MIFFGQHLLVDKLGFRAKKSLFYSEPTIDNWKFFLSEIWCKYNFKNSLVDFRKQNDFSYL